jgi:hypothetical protein
VHEAQVTDRSLFIPGGYPPELLEPVHSALGPTPQPVDLPLEPRRATATMPFRLPLLPLVFPLRDHVSDPQPAQQTAALGIAVAFIQRYLIRSLPRSTVRTRHADGVEHRFQLRALVPLPRRQPHRERSSAPVEGEV